MWNTKATYWLENDGSFAEGIRLLEEKGISTRRLAPKNRKHLVTPAMKAQVRNQVGQLLQSEPPPPQNPTSQPRHPRHGGAPQPENEPPEVEKLRDRGKRLLKRRSRLHALLCSASSDEERYEIAREMCVQVQPQVDQAYSAIRSWELLGEVPSAADQDDIVGATVKKMLRRDSLKVRLSQLRSKLRKQGLEDDIRQQYTAEMADKTAELEALEAELGL